VRAAVFRSPGESLRVEQLADPTPGAREVVIQVGRCGICATDLHLTEAADPAAGPPHPILRAMKQRFGPGSVLGHEYAGEVVAVGAEVRRLKVGDCITALPFAGCGTCAACLEGRLTWCSQRRSMQGGFGEYTRVDERSAIRLPASLSLADGALVEPLAVGHHGVDVATLRPGARVLVLGAGAMGLAIVFWARRLGTGPIAVSARSTRRAEMARTMGATAFVAQGDDLPARAAVALGGAPDVVFECTGAAGLLALAMECAGPRAAVIVVGMCSTSEPVVPVVGIAKELTMRFVMAYGAGDFEAAVDTLDRGALEPRVMVTDTVSLDEFPIAFEALRSPTDQCKVQLDPGRS
jgi:threonine dehydrogenase-like Zn-dependent dehydrogenase